MTILDVSTIEAGSSPSKPVSSISCYPAGIIDDGSSPRRRRVLELLYELDPASRRPSWEIPAASQVGGGESVLANATIQAPGMSLWRW